MRGHPSQIVGVAWYSRDARTRLRAIVPDREALEGSYEDWLAVYTRGVADLRGAGLRPERVAVDPDAFLAWCAVASLPLDSGSRARFAADELRRHAGSGRPPRGV